MFHISITLLNNYFCVYLIHGYEIDFTLWEAYTNQFMAYTTEHISHGHTIIIITHAMCQQSSSNA